MTTNEQRLRIALRQALGAEYGGCRPSFLMMAHWRKVLKDTAPHGDDMHVDRVPTSVDVEACERVVNDGQG